MCKIILFLLLINVFQFKEQKDVFDQTQIKNMKLKNRFFRGSIGDCSFIDGHISEEGLNLYENLAKNEVGTIFTGYITVSDYDQHDNFLVFKIYKDEYVEEYKKLTSLVHKYGSNILAQIVHLGMNTFATNEIIYCPSKMPIINQPERMCHEMTKSD